jgi:hypothetical protein
MVEELLGDDITNTIGGPAMAGIIPIAFEIKAVVEGDFLTLRDIPIGHNPQAAFLQGCVTIWRATVIQETGRVPTHIPIEIDFRSKGEDIDIILFAAPQRFPFINPFTHILNHARAF